MRALLDTNVLLDFLLKRDIFNEDAQNILLLGNAHIVDLCVCDLSIANIAYITRKDISKANFYATMRRLSSCYDIIPIGGEIIKESLKTEWDDFEDSLQYHSALAAGVDCIVTRNVKDFNEASIPVLTPSSFLKSIEDTYQ